MMIWQGTERETKAMETWTKRWSSRHKDGANCSVVAVHKWAGWVFEGLRSQQALQEQAEIRKHKKSAPDLSRGKFATVGLQLHCFHHACIMCLQLFKTGTAGLCRWVHWFVHGEMQRDLFVSWQVDKVLWSLLDQLKIRPTFWTGGIPVSMTSYTSTQSLNF